MVLCGPILASSGSPWVFDSLEVLNGFLRQVVVSRRDG